MIGSGRFGDFHQKIVNPEFIRMSLEKEFNQRIWVHWIVAPGAPHLIFVYKTCINFLWTKMAADISQ
jgi:hypothetical protein